MKFKLPRRSDWASTYVHGTLGCFATIDPGLGGTGWAVWSRETAADVVAPVASGCILPCKLDEQTGWNWERVAADMAFRMHTYTRGNSCFEYLIELPQLMDSGVGQIAARSGDLVKLTVITGMILGIASVHNAGRIEGVTPTKWKGNIDKDETAFRVRRALPNWKPKTNTSHEMDAVGLGLWAKGAL